MTVSDTIAAISTPPGKVPSHSFAFPVRMRSKSRTKFFAAKKSRRDLHHTFNIWAKFLAQKIN